jgi:hypothetical protein
MATTFNGRLVELFLDYGMNINPDLIDDYRTARKSQFMF